MHNVPYPIDNIISVADELAIAREAIATAFVLDGMKCNSHGYIVIEVWDS